MKFQLDILMDMKMPNINGLEASNRFSLHPDMSIIMMTAYGEMDVIKMHWKQGKNALLNPSIL